MKYFCKVIFKNYKTKFLFLENVGFTQSKFEYSNLLIYHLTTLYTKPRKDDLPVHEPLSTKKVAAQVVHEFAPSSVHDTQLESAHAEMKIATSFSKIV